MGLQQDTWDTIKIGLFVRLGRMLPGVQLDELSLGTLHSNWADTEYNVKFRGRTYPVTTIQLNASAELTLDVAAYELAIPASTYQKMVNT